MNNNRLEQIQPLARWKAALYIRLSKEDGDKNESYSVTSQREILKEYLKIHQDIEAFDIYVDDGWSGTNFERPDFQRMMDDIYKGKVNCVIVKDLSRFGRNYTDCGYYLDEVFVKLQVRFISLNNSIDSFSDNMNAATRCISIGVQNVINESLAATTSVNVRGTLNVSREQGKFIGSFPSYGYIKSPEDHHKLIVDDEAAGVVKQIFAWFISGKSIMGIAKELNDLGIPNPSTYKRMKGMNYRHPHSGTNHNLWSDYTVRRVLQNQMYIGDMVQGKNTTISYKISKCRQVPKEDWIIVENTHEPIIDRETFFKAQSLFKNHIRKPAKKSEVDLLSGLVYCANCMRVMNKKTNVHSYGTYQYYRCVTAIRMSKNACRIHSVRVDKLEKIVLVTVQKMIETAVEMSEVLDRIESSPNRKSETSHLEKSLQTYKNEKEKQLKLQIELYPDFKNGILTKEEYLHLKNDIAEKIKNIDDKINALSETIEKYQEGIGSGNSFIATFKKYGNIDRLTRPIVLELVDKIFIHLDKSVEVRFKFQDAYMEAMEYIEQNTTD